jgi:hypothetical protein
MFEDGAEGVAGFEPDCPGPEWPEYDGPVDDLPMLPDELSFIDGPEALTGQLSWMVEQPVPVATMRTLALIAPVVQTPRQKMLYAAVWQKVEAATAALAMQARVDAARPSGKAWTNDADALESELALVLRRTDNAV